MRRLLAFLLLRCPHCLQGRIFYGLLKMHQRCPRCNILYEREQGFFMNAIFFGYILGFIAILPFNVILYIYEAPPIYFLVGTVLLLTLISPLVFRYSRALWMHLDEMLDPRPDEDENAPPTAAINHPTTNLPPPTKGS